MKKTKWSKRITVFIFSLMAIFLSLSIFSTNNNYQEIQTQQKNEVSILENAQNSIENSFSRYVNKNEENNGKSLISIYSAIGDQDIKTSNGALAANSSNDFDLLHKLEQLNLDFKDNRLSGVSNDLRIIVNNFDDQDFKDLKFLSILNNLNSLTIIDDSTNDKDSLNINSTDDFMWINDIEFLESFTFKTSDMMEKNSSIDFSENIFNSRNIKKIDISNASYKNNSKNFSLFSSFSPNLNWFKNKNTDFELQISNDLSSTIPENIDIYEKEKSILKENTFIIKKIIGPQIDYNNFSSRYLYIDDVKISKRLYESKNYWDVDPKTFENILGIDTVTGRFYSTLQNSPDFLKLSPTTIENDYENFYNQAKLNASKEFSIIRDLSNIDKKDIKLELNKFIYVDQVQKKSFINNNIIYWNINPKTIKFASNDHTHFWTSISNITASDIETYNISYYDFFGKFDDWSVILKSEIIPPRIDKVNLVYDDYLILEPHWNFQSNNYNYSIDAYRKMYPSRATKFKYYSQKSNLIYSSIDHILASSHNISEFNQLPDDIINSNLKVFHDDENSINNITDKQNIDDYLNNNINSESKIVKKWLARPTISIDGINVGLFLFNEKFYVNFDISNIKYVALDKVKNEYQYFTSKDLIPSNLVSDIEIYAYSGEGQPSIKSILNPSVGANQRMRMKINNGIVINAVIDSNQLVWDFSDTNFQLSDIKYVDNNNNYYTDPILKIIENSGGSMPKGLSSVKQMNSIQVKPPVDSKLLNPVISNNIDEINQYDNIFIDSIQYKRRVYRSLVNWVSDNSEIADISYIKYQLISKFADGSSSETNYFFTNIKNAKDYSEENYLNGNTRITNNITPSMNYKPFLLEAPTAADQKLIISNGNENDTEVKVIKKNNEFYWDDKQKELISKIKFVNEDKFGNLKYYVNLNSNKSDEYNSVTDVEISPDIFAKTNAENKEDKKDLINNKKNTLYIFVGIIGLIGIVSITMFIFKIKSIKGGK